jgi:hypothetical protein
VKKTKLLGAREMRKVIFAASRRFALTLLLALPLGTAQAAGIALIGGTLIDGQGGPPVRNSVV